MNKISDKTDRTVVKIFINILASSIFLFASSSFAAEDAKPSTPSSATPPASNGISLTDLATLGAKNRCDQASQKLTEIDQKIGDACRKAGLGDVSSCVSSSKSCAEVSDTESFDTMGALATALGMPAGSTSSVGSKCPQMNGRDYFTEKDKIQKEIKDTEKDLADLNDDKAKLQEDYDKDMMDIKEALRKAQEDYKKKSLEIDKADREKVADFNSSQNQAKEELRKRGAEVLSLQGKLITSQRDKALKMIAMTDASGKRACMKAVRDQQANYTNSRMSIAEAKKKKQDLINVYNDCMDAFDQQRVALNESKRQEQDELNQQIANAKSSMDEIQNTLNLSANQLQEIQNASTKEKADALQSVVDLGTESQTKMQTAFTKLQEKQKTLAAKSQSLQAALNRANQSLMTLGPAPKSRSADYTPAEASSEISSQINTLKSIQTTYSDCPTVAESAKQALKKYGNSGTK